MNQPLFGELLFGLRRAGLKIGLSEWMSLMKALSAGLVVPDLRDFYLVARAMLVKSESNYDTFDEVFVSVFGDRNRLENRQTAHDTNDTNDNHWLDGFDQSHVFELFDIEAEQLPGLELVPHEGVEHPLASLNGEEGSEPRDQRIQGGPWSGGTGGKSAFGRGGANASGVRAPGEGGARTAVKIASARSYRQYRSDRVIDTRAVAVALKKLRKITRHHETVELDVEDTIDLTCKNGGELTLEFRPPRKNEAKVLLLMDVGGSMDPYAHLVEQIFSAAHNLQHWRRFEAFSFHNCPYQRISVSPGGEEVPTFEVIHAHDPETYVILVGDAYMAPAELLEPHGTIDDMSQCAPGIVWLHRLRAKFPHVIWLNPMKPEGWLGFTTKLVAELVPMFPLTVAGLEDGVDALVRKEMPRLPRLSALHPDLARFEEA